MPDDAKKVLYRAPSGAVFRVDNTPEEIAKADKSGWQPASEADVKHDIARQRAGTVGGQVKAAGEGLAAGFIDAGTAIPRAATAISHSAFGTRDPYRDVGFTGRNFVQAVEEDAGGVLSELTGGKTAEAEAREIHEGQGQRLRAEANPITAGAATIAGQVLGSGGLSALGKGAGGAVASRLGGGALARVAGAGVAGALEGAPLNLVAQQDQAYIEGRKLTGEQAMSSLGVGALLGGGVGAGLKGLGEVFGAAKNKVGQALATRAEAAAATGEERGAVQKILRTSDDDINRTIKGTLGEEAQPKAAEYLREGYKRGGLAEVQATEQGEAARALRSHINELETGTKNLSPEWREAKAANVAKTIARDTESVAAQTEIANEQISTIREKLAEMKGDPAAYGDRATLNKLERHITVAERQVSAAAESGRGEDMFVALDNLKRKMGPLARPGRMLTVAADAESAREVRGLYDGLRDALTHDAWGEAGAMQKEVNGAYEKWLGTKSLFDQRFMTETGKEGWQKTYGADPGKIESFVSGLGKSRNDLTNSIIDQHLESTKSLAEALSKAGELTPEKAAELKSIRSAAERFQSRATDMQGRMAAMEQANEVLSKAKEGHGALGASAIGHFIGGPVGAAAGVALGAVSNPAKFMTQRLALEQLAAKAEKITGQSLDRFFDGMRTVGQKVGEVTKKIPIPPAVPTALELFQGRHATPEIAYQKRVQELQQASVNFGQQIRDGAGRAFGTLAADDPHAVNAAVVSATKGVQVLLSALPVGTFNPKSLTPNASRPTPTKLEIQQFADIWTAVNKPMDVIKQIPDGTVTVPQMKTIQQIYPAWYGSIRQDVIARLAKMDADGIEVPIHAIDTLDTLLDLGDAAGPTYSTAFAVKYSQQMGDTAAKARQPRPPKPSAKGSVGSRLSAGTSYSIMGGS